MRFVQGFRMQRLERVCGRWGAALYRGLKAEVTLEVYTGYRAFSLGLLLDIQKDSKRTRGVRPPFHIL